jgi:hypothetical protein
VVVEGAQPADTSRPDAVMVRPGDVIVIGPIPSSASSGAPAGRETTPSPVTLSIEGRNVLGTPTPIPEPSTFGRDDALSLPHGMLPAIQYLPRGALYVVGAPFPLAARSLEDLATVPEMLVWYTCEVFAAWGLLLLLRRRRFDFAYGLIVLTAIAFVLSLFEGNVGTLVRHRAMMIPFTAVLSAIGASQFLARFGRFPVVGILIGGA